MTNRYANDWDSYSDEWESQFGRQFAHLGDEWHSGINQHKIEDFIFNTYAARWLHPDQTALEIGPGGGKWTVRIAPLVKKLIVLDVAEKMLKRTEMRCKSLGLKNIEYILGNGNDFQPIPDNSIDFLFSYDVFVHIAMEDTFPYTQEFNRILVNGGIGVCHYANAATDEAWERIEQNNWWYRGGRHTLGQFYYYAPDALRRMYENCGLVIVEQHLLGLDITCVFQKTFSIVSRLEYLLRQLISQEADDDDVRMRILAELRRLPYQLQQETDTILSEVEPQKDYFKRLSSAGRIRRLWRG